MRHATDRPQIWTPSASLQEKRCRSISNKPSACRLPSTSISSDGVNKYGILKSSTALEGELGSQRLRPDDATFGHNDVLNTFLPSETQFQRLRAQMCLRQECFCRVSPSGFSWTLTPAAMSSPDESDIEGLKRAESPFRILSQPRLEGRGANVKCKHIWPVRVWRLVLTLRAGSVS